MRQNNRLPNLHNLGIHLRILVVVNLLVALASLLLSKQTADFFPLLTQLSALVQPILLGSLVVLYVAYPKLKFWRYQLGLGFTVAVVLVMTYFATTIANQYLMFDQAMSMPRNLLIALIVSAIVLYYFYLQQRAYSPAIAEARLQALQARIRPHFLFNSINAVLSLIRSQPKRAETALEDLADLFRVLMADNRDLVPISAEIALCRQYLEIEKLRLDERLKITWQIEEMPFDALIPPLILQPLLENAVYHGIEPLSEGGEIVISVRSQQKSLHIEISNPFSPQKDKHSGNKMALNNIQERLRLHFDLEASLSSAHKNNRYHVRIQLPQQSKI